MEGSKQYLLREVQYKYYQKYNVFKNNVWTVFSLIIRAILYNQQRLLMFDDKQKHLTIIFIIIYCQSTNSMDFDHSQSKIINSDSDTDPQLNSCLTLPIQDNNTPQQEKQKTKRIRKTTSLLTQNKGTRPQKNTGPNGIKKILNQCAKDPYLMKCIQSIQNPCFGWQKNKKNGYVLQIITKAKCYKTQLMKFLYILRKELIKDELNYFSMVFQKTINESISFQEKKKMKLAKNRKDCQKVIVVLNQIKMVISFFLQSDPITYSQRISQIREKIFKTKNEKNNAGVNTVQKMKLKNNESQIPSSLSNGDWDDVLDLGDESQNMEIQKIQIFNISYQK